MSVTQQKLARLAGSIYLVTVITGIFSLMYVPNKMFIWDDFKETIQLFRDFEFLFQLSIVSEILCYLAFLILPMVLFRIFEKVNKTVSIMMVLFVLVAVPISLLAVSHKLNMLDILRSETVSHMNVEQLQAQVGFYYNKVRLAEIFWGLWLLPFGYLIYKSGLIPKILGVFLILGGIGYIINFLGPILDVNFADSLVSTIAKIPSSIGEIGTCLWLLIVGVKRT